MKFTERVRAASAAFRGKSADSVELNKLFEFLGIDPKNTNAKAMSEATYFACIKVRSEALGKLPFKIQQYTENGGIRIAREHPYYRMLNERPNRYMTASTFWSYMEMCRDHYGNSYAWIDTRKPKMPQLWPLNPENVEVWYDNARVLSDVPDVFYRYSTPEGVTVFSSEEVLHFKSHYTKDGLVGISVREQLASTIQGNVQAQEFINKTIKSGMTAKSVLNYTGSLNDASVKALVKEVTAYARSEKGSKGLDSIIPMPVGFSLTPLNLKLADSQFLELRQYSALQIASAFGVKPYQVGDYTKSSYASAEAQQLSFLVDTLLYNLKHYEEEVDYKLISNDDATKGYFSKFNVGVMLRADQKTQIETLSAAVANFLLTPNEARERLDLPAKEGGDQLLGNGASIPVQLTGAQYTNITAREEEKAWLKRRLKELETASPA